MGKVMILVRCATLEDLMNLPQRLNDRYHITFDEWSYLYTHVLAVLKRSDVAVINMVTEDEWGIQQYIQTDVEDIVNKHLRSGRDILMCQDELIDAGHAEVARM